MEESKDGSQRSDEWVKEVSIAKVEGTAKMKGKFSQVERDRIV